MQNVIVLLVDSVFSKCIGKGRTEISTTPFIDKLIAEGIYVPNTYSFGPYTDSATKGLYCGAPTLDDYGFYYCINGSEFNHYRVFKECGYETYGFYYPYYLLSSKTEKYIDHSIYISGFVFESVWNGKYQYYAERFSSCGLQSEEWELLIKITDMVFDCWMMFYYNMEIKTISKEIVGSLQDQSINGEKLLIKEYERYCVDKAGYIRELLVKGMSHPLAQISDYDCDRHINTEFVKNKVYKKYKGFFDKIYRKNICLNIKNRNISFGRIAHDMMKYIMTLDKNYLRYSINTGLLLSSVRLMKKRSFGHNWQLESSANKQIETLIKLLDERESDVPFYVSLHVEEPHHNIAFFSYDSEDESTIKEEIEYLTPLVEHCGNGFKGNLIYYLSLRYVDLCVERLYKYLQKTGLDKNTTLLIVADHGSSYTFSPMRDSVTNNFFEENYHIPMLIWKQGISPRLIEDYATSADVFPTLFDILGIDTADKFKGRSLVSDHHKREYIIHEYTGPGCPDLLSKEIWIAIRSEKYVIGYKVDLKSGLCVDKPDEFYRLLDDPNQLHNIANTFEKEKSNEEVQVLVSAVKNRYENIIAQTNRIIHNFKEFKVIDEEIGRKVYNTLSSVNKG